MGSDLYFFEQCEMRKVPRRYRKLPEELPEKLRFAHLNPKVQALLASKERGAKVDNEDPFGDGLGKKSLLPDINAAFTNVRNQFDSVLSNDEDSQRYLFEESKISASSILHQLSQIIYRYEDLYKHIPKSLEYHLMSGYNEFTSDVVVVPREWQTQEMKDQYNAKLQQETLQSEEDVSDTEAPTGRTKSRMGTDRSSSDLKSNLRRSKALMGSIETVNELDLKMESRQGKRSDSRMSATSVMRQHLGVDTMSRVGSRRKGSKLSFYGRVSRMISGPSPSIIRGRRDNDLFSLIAETPDPRSTVLGGPLSNYAMQTINFQLSNSAFEDKGWIMLKGRQEEVDQNQILEYCVQRLQESLKSITEQTTKEVEQGHDKPVVLRYYGDAKKETLLKYRKSPSKSGQSIVHRGGKPKIPTIVDERNEGKKLMHAQHIDGSAVLYYPSGRPALIHSAAGFGRPGFYTIVYEDGLDSRMIACFTPSGRGVCYHENGVVSFLATEKGGHLAEENGKLIRKWTWPKANVKITEPLSLQVNGQVCFRCVGQSQMTVSFSCQRETARFNVGHNPDIEARAIEEGDQLLTGLTFSSKAARDLMRIFAPNKKRKKTRKHTSKSQSSEIQKLLQDFPDKVSYELEADKDLAKLQRKARILVDDWMEHYRLAVGLIPAELLTVRDSPQRYSIQGRNTKSARMSDQGLLIRRAILGVDSTDWEETPRKKMRIPSAPLAGLGGEIDEDLAARIASQQQQQQPESSEEKDAGSGDGTVTPSAMVIINRMAETASRRSARSRATSARTMSPTRQQTTLTNVGGDCVPSATPQGGRSHCPLVIRQQKLGYDSPSCRCSRHYIPNIMDIELDDFVEKDCPEEQLIVIMVVSSLKGIKGQHGEQVDYSFYMDQKGHPYRKVFPGITKAEEMVNEIYQNQNRNRTRPCVQSRSDMFRVFKYDINSAAEMSNHTQPILLTRHNVVPGMFLIYSEGKLLFCDHIFNGYGNTRKDFKKQIMKSRHDAIQGFSLPKDFRFSPSKGRHGLRSGWGGEIGGAGVDEFSSRGTIVDETLQPIHRPTSDSSERSKELHLDAVNEKVDLGPFHREIQVRLRPLMYRSTSKSRLNPRPFLPHIGSSQTAGSTVH
ncbi:uncharacterized protein LOC128217895 isoform X3 [Mya arenaria]|uniref:uncharacterized protein LOC128217895 isoform X3 n=1 Tax=Mya arenaria TaxID=6604 RepID=UPI0022E43844|nr:uncharacterized protein LOC128217895 isoform X3 [Mya arenaria]